MKYYCIDCGKEKKTGTPRCGSCGAKHRKHHSGWKHTEEAKRKISEKAKGKKNALGYRWTDEQRARHTGEGAPMYGKKHTTESRKKMSEAHSGENNYMYGRRDELSGKQWKGGKCSERVKDCSRYEGRMWSKGVQERDNYTCQNCKVTSETNKLHAHHIKEWEEYPELRYEVSNGLTLCVPCHRNEHIRRNRLKRGRK